MTDTGSTSPLEALLRLPATLAEELANVLPRLTDRTRAQVDFAATLLEKLRCGDLGSRLSGMATAAPERLADVVPFEPRDVIDAATSVARSEPVREVIDVVTVAAGRRTGTRPTGTEPADEATPPAAAPARAAAKKAPAKKAPAKKAPAKKAPAKKAPAKKAPAKKAPAKKAPAKKAPAKKAPAKKAPAKKAPAKKAPAKKAPVAAAPASTAVPTAESLAIPGYDALAASQVVPRLESLAPADLDAVRRYEAAGRGRRTILSRIAQLQAG